MKQDHKFSILEDIAIPIWIIDYVNLQMIWGNARAIELWGATDLEDLRERDFSNTSAAIRARHRATQTILETGESETRLITFYPRERPPVTVRCHISGFHLDDGRLVAMTQAIDAAVSVDPEQLRGVDAIRRIGATVTLLDQSGMVLMQNPAGAHAFGTTGSFHRWFVDASIPPKIEQSVQEKHVYRAEVQVETHLGERWHAIEAHPSVDPVTALPAILILQVDVTENRLLQQAMALQAQQIRTLSVPILDVGRGILAVPLMGIVDEERRHEIAARLLPELSQRGTKTVILDLTGVTTLDAASAEGLMMIARALRLLGCQSILTGIQPILAKVLTEGGVDLGGILTLRNVHEALQRSHFG